MLRTFFKKEDFNHPLLGSQIHLGKDFFGNQSFLVKDKFCSKNTEFSKKLLNKSLEAKDVVKGAIVNKELINVSFEELVQPSTRRLEATASALVFSGLRFLVTAERKVCVSDEHFLLITSNMLENERLVANEDYVMVHNPETHEISAALPIINLDNLRQFFTATDKAVLKMMSDSLIAA